MEKSGTNQRKNFCSGLLVFSIFFLFANTAIISANNTIISANNAIIFIPQKNIATVDEIITFTAIVPNVYASNLDFSVKSLPKSVRFVSSQKKPVSYKGNAATSIDLDFVFEATGMYTLEDIILRVNGKKINVPFEQILVLEKKENMIARAVWKVPQKNDLYTHEKIPVLLQVFYVKKIVSINYQIPENSLFTLQGKLKTDFEQSEETDFSGVTVGKFDWIALLDANYSIPQANLTVVDIFNQTKTINLAPQNVLVQKNPREILIKEESVFLFSDAFADEQIVPEVVPQKNRDSIIETLIFLRTQEREKIFFFANQAKRKQLELEYEIENNPPEFPKIILYVTFFGCAGILLCIGIRKIIKKNTKFLLIFLLFCFFALGFQVYLVSKKYALIVQPKVFSVPDEAGSLVAQLPIGTRIVVKKTIGQWNFIEFDKNKTGWIQSAHLQLY